MYNGALYTYINVCMHMQTATPTGFMVSLRAWGRPVCVSDLTECVAVVL